MVCFKKFRTSILFLSLMMVMMGCSVTSHPKDHQYILIQNKNREHKKWKLVWQEDFNSPKLAETKWARVQKGNPDWKKHMSNDENLLKISDGTIKFYGISNPDTLKDTRKFLTAGILSKNKFAFQYGKVEIKAKFNSAQGAWPALWMLPELELHGQYPHSGEIDIMEHLNFDDFVYHTIHSHYTRNLKQENNPPHFGTGKINRDGFNVYSVQWYPDRLEFFVNNKKTFTYTKKSDADPSQWPFTEPFYLILGEQLGGEWVGPVTTPSQLPAVLEIDWVRVYQ